MSFVPIRKQDLAVGGPLPWAVYDRQKNLLLRSGYVLESEAQLTLLIEQGLFRKAHAEQTAPVAEASVKAPEAPREGPQKEVPLEDVKLQIGDALQLQPLSDSGETRHYVKLIGYQKNQALLVTTPAANGMVLLMKDGQAFVVRVFSGKSVFAFTATILKTANTPFPHLFLTYPKSVRGLVVRKGERLRAKIIGAVSRPQEPGGNSTAITIMNISTSGAMLCARAALGAKGDVLALKFKLALNDIESYLTIAAVIRNVQEGVAGDDGAQPFQHGVEFTEMAQQDMIMLTAYIYQKLIDESSGIQ